MSETSKQPSQIHSDRSCRHVESQGAEDGSSKVGTSTLVCGRMGLNHPETHLSLTESKHDLPSSPCSSSFRTSRSLSGMPLPPSWPPRGPSCHSQFHMGVPISHVHVCHTRRGVVFVLGQHRDLSRYLVCSASQSATPAPV